MHPDFQKFAIDDKKCYKIYEMCQKNNLPLLLHTGDHRYDYSNPDRMKRVLEDFPELTVIGAHFGGWSCWKKAAETLSSYNNFYVDCSSSFDWLTADESRNLVRLYGADHVLFATDSQLCKIDFRSIALWNANRASDKIGIWTSIG